MANVDSPSGPSVDSLESPSLPEETPAPLRVIPKTQDTRVSFVRDTITYALLLLSIASVIYVLFYAASAGWHDAAYA